MHAKGSRLALAARSSPVLRAPRKQRTPDKSCKPPERFFDLAIAAAHDENPHGNGRDRHGNVFADAENLHGGRDAGKLRHGVAEVHGSAASMTKKVERNPNSSRIRSERPLPVTTPMRAHISSLT